MKNARKLKNFQAFFLIFYPLDKYYQFKIFLKS